MESKLAKIIFHDHVEDGSEPVKCEVFGKVLKQTKLYITICSWDIIDTDDETRSANQKTFVILKSTIVSKKFYR